MSTTATRFSKAVLVVLTVVLTVAAGPVVKAHALGASVVPTPPAPGGVRGQRLGLLWQRELSIRDRMEYAFDHAGERLALAQEVIDQTRAKGRDTAAVQAALNALAGAIQKAKPLLDRSSELIATHQGFDASGNVIDPFLAAQTIKAVSEKLRMAGGPVMDARTALRAAVQDLRRTYPSVPKPLATPSP
jgi:hypothetical protein